MPGIKRCRQRHSKRQNSSHRSVVYTSPLGTEVLFAPAVSDAISLGVVCATRLSGANDTEQKCAELFRFYSFICYQHKNNYEYISQMYNNIMTKSWNYFFLQKNDGSATRNRHIYSTCTVLIIYTRLVVLNV